MRTAAFALTTLAAAAVLAPRSGAEIAWHNNLRAAHAKAEAEGKNLLLHFYTDNCPWCDKLEEGAFRDPEVWQAINHRFVPVKVHARENPKLTQMFSVKKFPTDVVVTTAGKTLSHSVSPQDPGRYVAMLAKTLSAPATTAVAAAQPPAEASAPTAAAAAGKTSPPQAAGPGSSFNLPTATLDGGFAGPASGQLAAARQQTPGMTLPGDSPEPSSVEEPASPPAAAATPTAGAETLGESEPEANQPELALQGFCAVSVIDENEWVEGSPEFGVIHLGRLYLFASEAKMETFLANPVPYTPVLNEIDVVRFFEERRIVPGKREWGLKDPIYNRMFFFADEAAMNHFWNEHERYTDAAVEVMQRAIRDANPGS